MHVLILGHGRHMPATLRALDPSTTVSVLCEIAAVPRVRDLAQVSRLVGVTAGAPVDEWVELARGVHNAAPVDVVAAFGEWLQDVAAAVGEALGARSHAPSTVRDVHDKTRTRAVLAAAGLDDVRRGAVTRVDQAQDVVASVGTPCIVKPGDGVGSRGVTLVERPADAARAFLAATGGRPDAVDAPVVVEEYLVGPQFSVDMVGHGGEHRVLGVVRKYSDPASFVELGHVAPAPVAPDDRDALARAAVAAVTALGVTEGATHTELVLTARGARIIETHLRLGGDDIPRLVEDTTGVVPEREAARSVLRLGPESAPVTDPRGAASAIWFVPARVAGRLVELRGLDAARAADGVVAVDVLRATGADVRPLAESSDRVASVRAVGPDPRTALERARVAAALVRVVVEQDAPAALDALV
ncbi:ATP-grasp domain-containing protein [Cellulomonas sp. H30R-01]|uniref:ATP-grasp domain-containing protein n=1 Tax=Cellulomonas sp. H30R-01 TaxID=2704467 RepID=UPI00138BB626|nr:ATP-grasp domain-containing protein [Cellulomonas sp. H30R-01]QHT57567.1 ATP-grasp domain-containing protein [Cellulomonas sp. H30R-01]